MKEGLLNIKLVKEPSLGYCNKQYKTNGGRFDNRTKSVFIVYHILLLEALSNKSRLITIDRSVCSSFYLVNPFVVNEIFAFWWRNQAPSLIALQRLKFTIHGSNPFGN